MAKIIKRKDIQKANDDDATKGKVEETKQELPKVHPMPDDFRVPKKRRGANIFGKLTDEEFERERLRQIRREDSWMARSRGY